MNRKLEVLVGPDCVIKAVEIQSGAEMLHDLSKLICVHRPKFSNHRMAPELFFHLLAAAAAASSPCAWVQARSKSRLRGGRTAKMGRYHHYRLHAYTGYFETVSRFS